MWILVVLLCACAVTSTSAFYEPVENYAARPFYKQPPTPPVTVLDYRTSAEHRTQAPGLLGPLHIWELTPVTENKPIQQVHFSPSEIKTPQSKDFVTLPWYKPPVFKSTPTTVTDPVPSFKEVVPVFTSFSSVPLQAPSLASTDLNPLTTYNPPTVGALYGLSDQEVTPLKYLTAVGHSNVPLHVGPQPGSHQAEQDATSFQSVAYMVTKQAYRKPTH